MNGRGFQIKVLQTFLVVPSWIGGGDTHSRNLSGRGFAREKMLKGHLPRVIYHQVRVNKDYRQLEEVQRAGAVFVEAPGPPNLNVFGFRVNGWCRVQV